ncbi:hypothetical protein TKK_0012350 [Trichogramma kaykai]
MFDYFNSRYFIINKLLMSSVGIWPYENNVKKLCLKSFFITFIFISALPQIYGLYKHFGHGVDKIIEHSTLTLYLFQIELKLVTTILSEKKLKILYDSLEKNWSSIKNPEELHLFRKYLENGRFLTIGYMTYMTSAMLFYVIMPVAPTFLENVFSRTNETKSFDFVMKGEFPVNNMRHYYFEIFIFDMLVCVATVFVLGAVDSTYAACTEHCIGLFGLLKFRLVNLTPKISQNYSDLANSNYDQDDATYNFFVDTIKLHQKSIRFAEILKTSYSLTFLILMGATVIYSSLVCTLILLKGDELKDRLRYSGIFVGLLIHLFYISWPGQKLIDHSTGLFDDAYTNKWYECNFRTKNLLRIVRLRCLTPCQLTASDLYIMNFPNFAAVLKTSMSYMTVLASFI